MASENSAQVEAAEAVFWVANTYSEVTGNYIDRTTNNVIPTECPAEDIFRLNLFKLN